MAGAGRRPLAARQGAAGARGVRGRRGGGKYFMLEAPDLQLKLMAFSGHLTKKIKTSPTETYTAAVLHECTQL